jgi:DNA-binding MarR family transcriptional regulator
LLPIRRHHGHVVQLSAPDGTIDRVARGAGADGPASDVEIISRELRSLIDRSRTYSLQMAAQVHPGLESSQYLVLVDLAEMGPVRSSELAARRRVDKGLISRQITALAGLGLVVRMPDPDDSRAALLTLSPAGAKVMQRMERDRRRFAAQVFASLTAEQRANLARSLTELNAAIAAL